MDDVDEERKGINGAVLLSDPS